MKQFSYPLQRVLDAREAKTNLCEAKLSQSIQLVEKARRQQQICKEALQDHARRMVDAITHPSVARDLRSARAWMLHLSSQLDRSKQLIEESLKTVDQRRTELKQSLIEKKIIENHSKRQRQIWLEQTRKTEQKLIDEQATNIRSFVSCINTINEDNP